MNINISNAEGKPIYEQIVSQIKGLLLAGKLCQGDPLPSMRLLAKELRISVITTKRAYEELEKTALSSPSPARAVCGRDRFGIGKEEQLRMIEGMMQKIVETASGSGWSLSS